MSLNIGSERKKKESRSIFSLLQYQYNKEVHLWYLGHLTTSDWAVTSNCTVPETAQERGVCSFSRFGNFKD